MISIITPALRPDRTYLRAAAQSIEQQINAPEVEWVVLAQDDADGVAASVLSEVSFPTQLITNDRPLGVAAARNICRLAARHPWIFPLDADDELPPNALEVVAAAAASSTRPSWVIGSGETFTNQASLATWPAPHAAGPIRRGALVDLTTTLGYLPTITLAGLYRASLLDRIGGWPALPRDEDTFVKLAVSALADGYVVDESIYRYRRHGEGQTTFDPAFEHLQVPSRTAVVELLTTVSQADATPIDWDLWHQFIHGKPPTAPT